MKALEDEGVLVRLNGEESTEDVWRINGRRFLCSWNLSVTWQQTDATVMMKSGLVHGHGYNIHRLLAEMPNWEMSISSPFTAMIRIQITNMRKLFFILSIIIIIADHSFYCM